MKDNFLLADLIFGQEYLATEYHTTILSSKSDAMETTLLLLLQDTYTIRKDLIKQGEKRNWRLDEKVEIGKVEMEQINKDLEG